MLRLLCDDSARGAFLDAWGLPRDALQAILQRSVLKARLSHNFGVGARKQAGWAHNAVRATL